jgi:hypothetical protein
MIIKPVYTTGSINKKHIDEHDFMVLEYLVSEYGSDIVFESINEATYYGTGGNFDRTGGSRVSGISGLLQSLPSLAITTAICWPVTLLAGLGALSYRIRKNYEDKDSWLNRLNPRFWVDYLATPSKDNSSSSSYSSLILPLQSNLEYVTGYKLWTSIISPVSFTFAFITLLREIC